LKIGASLSLLIATIVFDVRMPAMCWMAPEMPTATYRLGLTTRPVCPIWSLCGRHPSARRTALAALLFAAAIASPDAAGAQADASAQPTALVRVRRAFEPALTAWLGTTKFGSRTYDANATYGYASSITVGATVDLPLTRRTGLMIDASVLPGSKQEASSGAGLGSYTARSAVVATADAGLAGRLKANVPVFLFAGVGMLHSSRVPSPFGTGSTTEPRGTIALGYDAGLGSASRAGLRAVVAAHFAKPGDSGVADETTKSITTDYSFRLGLRWRLSGGAAR